MQDTSTKTPEEKSSVSLNRRIHHTQLGPLLGILMVILALILVGLYLWGAALQKQQTTPPPITNNEPETPRAVSDVQIIETTSPSDELDAIQADLDGTLMNSADSDLDAIETELKGALGE